MFLKTAVYKFARPVGNTIAFFLLSAVAYVSADYWQSTARKPQPIEMVQLGETGENESAPSGAIFDSSPARKPASLATTAYESSWAQGSPREGIQDRDTSIAHSFAQEAEEGIQPDDAGALNEAFPVSGRNFSAAEAYNSSPDALKLPTSPSQTALTQTFGGNPQEGAW